jgi:glycosyltransferase involved in cell wall biosynthesis
LRLAIVSPLPPAASGIADYTADLVALLAARHELELFHGQAGVDASRFPHGVLLYPAEELEPRSRERPFDLVVHQLGNNHLHDFQYPLLSRVPGLLVLHELVLHHARAARFLESDAVRAWRASPGSVAARREAEPMLEAWRAELEYAYPGRGDRLHAAQLGTVGDLLPYAYPLFRIPVEASRAVAVHNRYMADAVRDELPGTVVLQAPMPVSRLPVASGAVRELRGRLGFAEGDVVVGVFGLLTPEKRVASVAHAVAGAARKDDRLRLLLVGPVLDEARLAADLERSGVANRSVVAGRVSLADLALHIEAADVVAHLRYPSARETSAALLRVLAQGRPTVVSDLEHQAELPADVVVKISLADESAALQAALEKLAGDAPLRDRLARAAAEYLAREHAPDRVASAWDELLEKARRAPVPAPRPGWPAHWPRPQAVSER